MPRPDPRRAFMNHTGEHPLALRERIDKVIAEDPEHGYQRALGIVDNYLIGLQAITFTEVRCQECDTLMSTRADPMRGEADCLVGVSHSICDGCFAKRR